ncbi:MAG: putative L,D-transpeptidase YkuD [Candidatus Hydrogenedentota bacterium]|jgi:tetratricopeptide (TPR) repeat protein
MPKRYFVPNRAKRDTSLLPIIIGVTLFAALLYGGGRVFSMLSGDAAPTEIAAETAPDASEPAATTSSAVTPGPEASAAAADPELSQADAALKAGDVARARDILERAVQQRANTAAYPEAATRLARVLQQENQRERALALLTEVRDRAPAPWRAAALNGLAADAEQQGDAAGALALYESALKDAEPESPAWNEALDNLGRLNVSLIFSRTETPESKIHTVEPGENLTSIGIKLNTTQGLLMTANGIEDPATLRAGQRLKYTPKDFRILIERSTCRMFLLDSEGIFKRYFTGLGMPGYETTLGSYTIGNKQKDPTWFKPGSEPIPPNDPRNELGTRWMPLMPQEEGLPTDLGIHGTIDPESIGLYKSHGCPRLKKEDVEELYDLVVRSTPVQIVEKIDWETLGPKDPLAS